MFWQQHVGLVTRTGTANMLASLLLHFARAGYVQKPSRRFVQIYFHSKNVLVKLEAATRRMTTDKR